VNTFSAPNIIVVDSLDDDGGSCSPSKCTLRQAINDATDDETIGFDSSIHGGTITLSSQLTIDKDLTIALKSPFDTMTISGGDSTRLFYVDDNKSLTLRNLTLINGQGASSGGAVYNHWGHVTIENCRFEGNNTLAGGSGGALYNNGAVGLNTMEVDRSTFTSNWAGQTGGAIRNGGSLTVTDSTFDENSAVGRGGAIFNTLNADGLSIENSTFIENSTDSEGGAIYHDSGTFIYITNSTFYGNSAGVSGGGLYSYTSAETSITNCTFFNNMLTTSRTGARVEIDDTPRGAGVHIFNATLYLVNSILANNTGGYDCVLDAGGTPSEYNLIMNNAPTSPDSYECGYPNVTSAPMLQDPPDYNGGLTKNMALLTGSPAIDAGVATYCPDTDQRGEIRPQGGGCDLGSYELDSYPTVMASETAMPNPTTETHLDFTVTFNEPVTGVDEDAFSPAITGSITSANVINVDGVDDVYTVTVRVGSGSGTLRLDIFDDGSSIWDSTSHQLGGPGAGNGNYTYGEIYIIDYSFIYLPLVIK
jgi:predicted outer membrane repeat protein